jgi:GNAT superfamily N-acetyltransferase
MDPDTPHVDAARVAAIESAFVTHWRHFGEYPGAALHEERGVTWFESPIGHLPYNAVIDTLVPHGDDADARIREIGRRFRARRVPYLWVVKPSDRPRDLGRRLAADGLDLVERATGMDLDLSDWRGEPPAPGVEVRPAEEDPGLGDYEVLIRTYWSVPEPERHMIERLNRWWSGARSPGRRFVAYIDGRPVGKSFLNLEQLPVAGIYGVAAVPEARGRGVATSIMHAALDAAATAGATRVVLHSSPMAESLYRRVGFRDRCTFDVYATAALLGTHHH